MSRSLGVVRTRNSPSWSQSRSRSRTWCKHRCNTSSMGICGGLLGTAATRCFGDFSRQQQRTRYTTVPARCRRWCGRRCRRACRRARRRACGPRRTPCRTAGRGRRRRRSQHRSVADGPHAKRPKLTDEEQEAETRAATRLHSVNTANECVQPINMHNDAFTARPARTALARWQ